MMFDSQDIPNPQVEDLSKEGKKFCVIGHPISHSKSPQLHEAGFEEMEIEASFEKVDVAPENLSEWIRNEFPNFGGAAVTIPHKETIRKFLDFETEAATKIGAVNTLFWKEEQMGGTNTDGIGFLRALQTEVLNLKKKRVLILGAGGAARAMIVALEAAEAQAALWNRTPEKAQKLAQEFEIGFVEELSEEAFGLFDVIVNATSVGLKEWKSVIPENFWEPHQVAFDAVYDPLETKFLSDAEAVGARTVTGDKMLVFQALEQFKLWHGIELEPEVMEMAFFTD